jgi:predicted Ser/Thr protein kinase
MNCVHCQTPLPDNSRFCFTCGADVSDPGSGPRPTGAQSNLQARLTKTLEGRYRVTKMVGRGGMGMVFLAEDLTLERPVAIKVLPPDVSHDENVVGRFEREARTAARLDHPNIIPIFAVEAAADLHYFVMKYVSGRSLDELLKAGRLSIPQTQAYLWESGLALGHAHRRGVVHRDIKPANIMLDHDGRVILTDFGISKAMQAATQYTGTGQVVGTPHYMSPEQAKGVELDGRSDQYSLAVVGYQMVTGRLPFGDDSIHAIIYKHVSEEPPAIGELNPDCPPFLATALHRALSKKRDLRFPTMEEFAAAVCPERRSAISVSPVAPMTAAPSFESEAPTEISGTRAAQTVARRTSRWAAVAAIALLAVGGWWVWHTALLSRYAPAGNRPPPANEARDPGLRSNEALALRVDSAPVGEVGDSRSTPEPMSPDTTRVATEPSVVPVDTPKARRDTKPTVLPPRPGPPQPEQPQVGSITISAEPFASLFVDDVFINETPVFAHSLSPGRHVIRISRPGCQEKIDTLTVEAGREARQSYNLVCGSRS